MTEAKVIDTEMNEDGVMEQKTSFVKKAIEGFKAHKKEILTTGVKIGVGFIGGALFGYYVLPGVVEALTKPETVAEVAEAVVEATV